MPITTRNAITEKEKEKKKNYRLFLGPYEPRFSPKRKGEFPEKAIIKYTTRPFFFSDIRKREKNGMKKRGKKRLLRNENQN